MCVVKAISLLPPPLHPPVSQLKIVKEKKKKVMKRQVEGIEN
jgi:hypothetical protein